MGWAAEERRDREAIANNNPISHAVCERQREAPDRMKSSMAKGRDGQWGRSDSAGACRIRPRASPSLIQVEGIEEMLVYARDFGSAL